MRLDLKLKGEGSVAWRKKDWKKEMGKDRTDKSDERLNMKILIVFSLLLWFKLLPEKINEFVSNKAKITYSLHGLIFVFSSCYSPPPPPTHTPKITS